MIDFPRPNAKRPAPAINGKSGNSISSVLPDTEPANQNNTPCRLFSLITSIPLVNEVNNAETAAPARTILREDSPSPPNEPKK
ncbi:hypothetical protein D3C77_733170 [compost metagenome]